MSKDDEDDPQVIALLNELKLTPARNRQLAARARARFLVEAVSVHSKQRHSLWTIFQQKEQLAMKLITSTLVIVGLLFVGNATVAAAQDDLPNQSLYQLKLMSEDVHLWFTYDPVQQIDILMEQEQMRIQEMQTLAADGVIPPTDVADRAQERLQRALQIASQLDEASKVVTLQQIRTRLQTQEQQMLQLEQGTCTECIPMLKQTREVLQLQLGKMENGLTDPGALQNQDQTQTQNQGQQRISQTPWATGTAIPPYGTSTPALDGTGQQNGNSTPSAATPVQRQNQTQQQNQGEGGTQNGTGSGSGSSTGTGGQGGKP